MKFKGKIATLLLASTLLATSFTACQKAPPNNEITTPQEPAGIPGKDETLFLNYQEILDAISLFATDGGAEQFTAAHSVMSEREREISSHLPEFVRPALGYCIKDINADGVEELVLLSENWNLYGLFTIQNGHPVFVEQCDDGGIDKNGKVHTVKTKQLSNGVHTTYSVKVLANAEMITEMECGIVDYQDASERDEIYQVVNNEKKKLDQYDLQWLLIDYQFHQLNIITADAGIVCTRLLDIPAPFNSGKFFNITSLRDRNNEYKRTYFYEIYDTQGNVVRSGVSDDFYVYEEENRNQEILLSIYEDDDLYFYNVSKNIFSQKFERVCNHSSDLERIAYYTGKGEDRRLIVRDIFDKNVFYREYDHEAFGDDYLAVYFSVDGKSVTLQYHLTGVANQITRVLCFETLPILETKKICYIRTGPGLHFEAIHVSSGTRAVLRADTNDTIRLLSTTPVIGGEYESEGGIRNDWYMIDYKGKTCYVSADSFEVSTFVVEE